jgi:hypothetical protein
MQPRIGSGFLFETCEIRRRIENDYEDGSEDDEDMSLNSDNASQDYPAMLLSGRQGKASQPSKKKR